MNTLVNDVVVVVVDTIVSDAVVVDTVVSDAVVVDIILMVLLVLLSFLS